MRRILFFLALLCGLTSFAQPPEKFNLGFEVQENADGLSDGWFQWGSFDLEISEDAHSGSKSGKITSLASDAFGSIAYKIPAKYTGSTIKLEGYMKTKDVAKGFAGLLLRVDGDGGSLAFDNMQSKEITGTNDWKKYTITLNYSNEAEFIFVAGILVGEGEAWFDDFVLTIDGQDVQSLKEAAKILSPAEKDTEFDKGSNIALTNLSAVQYENLELLGRVWGFLKYHHPEIGTGNYNWDYELFRMLPKYLEAKNENGRDKQLLKWIESYGKIIECLDCLPTEKDAVLKPDLAWIDAQGEKLKKKLKYIRDNRAQGKHYYIKMAGRVGNPVFKNEPAFKDMPYPDDGFRLLSVYKYWNMIQYYFPYKHLTDKDWNTVLGEYIPLFINAKDEFEYEVAAVLLIGEVHDTHANLWKGGDKLNEWKGENYPPVHVRFIDNNLVVTDYYNEEMKAETGLEVGDIITKIKGKTIDEIIKEKTKLYPASNQPTRLRNIGEEILRSTESKIEITYSNEQGEEKNKTLKLYPIDDLNKYRWYKTEEGSSFKMLENNIGYGTHSNINEADISQIKKDFKDTKGIIIDIRNYPSTFVPFSLGGFFVSSPTLFAKFSQGNVNNPGEFTLREGAEIPNDSKPYQGKLVVLLNENSQSQAEYTAMAFRAGDNTTIIGSTTAGADGNISPILLPGGLRTVISGIGVYYPDGGETQRIGIVPDIEVRPTIEGIRSGKDELLDKAIEVILED